MEVNRPTAAADCEALGLTWGFFCFRVTGKARGRESGNSESPPWRGRRQITGRTACVVSRIGQDHRPGQIHSPVL